MKQTRSLMGMHITIEVVDRNVKQKDLDTVYKYFTYIDEKFSTYKKTSEVSLINLGKIQKREYSPDMKKILALCEQTKKETNGYFNIVHDGKMDPSGIVKGWAIWQAAKLLEKNGFQNFYVDAGGDVQVKGKNKEGKPWTVGIRNPFKSSEIVKIISLDNKGIATSGTSMRGQHIYNPHKPHAKISDVISLSVIGPNVYEADRFATAAFAMGSNGIQFIEGIPALDGYMIDKNGIATYTSGFEKYVLGST
ncbi:MAG: FAD:protein FMN transferase [Candidatus Levyibacteriota bacterium]